MYTLTYIAVLYAYDTIVKRIVKTGVVVLLVLFSIIYDTLVDSWISRETFVRLSCVVIGSSDVIIRPEIRLPQQSDNACRCTIITISCNMSMWWNLSTAILQRRTPYLPRVVDVTYSSDSTIYNTLTTIIIIVSLLLSLLLWLQYVLSAGRQSTKRQPFLVSAFAIAWMKLIPSSVFKKKTHFFSL